MAIFSICDELAHGESCACMMLRPAAALNTLNPFPAALLCDLSLESDTELLVYARVQGNEVHHRVQLPSSMN